MLFKITSRNPFRDLIRNTRRITISDMSEDEKFESYKELLNLLKTKLHENERFLNSQTAFAKRCNHWNQRTAYSIKPVTNVKNPWLAFKKELEYHLQFKAKTAVPNISKSLAWFYYEPYREDWLAL